MAKANTSDWKRLVAGLSEEVRTGMLVAAGKAAANVVADEARAQANSDEARDSIKTRAEVEDGKIVARIEARGRGAFMALWAELGTDPHYIGIADEQRRGFSVRKVNDRVRDGVMVINGKPVRGTILHPGARPHPFLTPALDHKEAEALGKAQDTINGRVARLASGRKARR